MNEQNLSILQGQQLLHRHISIQSTKCTATTGITPHTDYRASVRVMDFTVEPDGIKILHAFKDTHG